MSRKLLIRLVGAPLILVVLGGILYIDWHRKQVVATRFLIAAAVALGMVEMLLMIRGKGHPVAWLASIVLVAAPMLPWSLTPWTLPHLPMLAAVVFTLAIFVKLVLKHGSFTVEGACLGIGAFAYLSLMNFAVEPPGGVTPALFAWYLVFLVATNKGSDMAAFVVGKSIGRRKMTPVLSPNKTWEGGIAGGIVGTAAGFAVLAWSPLRAAVGGVPLAVLAMLSILVTVASQIGDLAESAFKRWAGVKDSGRLIPEFGGILDMMDSFILSAPVAWLGLELIARAY